MTKESHIFKIAFYVYQIPLISYLLILQRLEVPERCKVTGSEEASVIVDFMC